MQTNRSVAELELRTREKVEAAKKKMSLEIAELKERLKASRENINVLKGEIRRLEEDDQMKDHWGGLQTGREHKHVRLNVQIIRICVNTWLPFEQFSLPFVWIKLFYKYCLITVQFYLNIYFQADLQKMTP